MADSYPGFREFELAGWENAEIVRHYERTIGALTQQSCRPLLDAADVATDSRVLDVACGPGFVTAAAAQRGATVRGIDFSSEQVAAATRRYPVLSFEVADASHLPFPAAAFDAVISSFGMLHFSDANLVAAEAWRVLVPGGRFAYTVWAQPEHVVAMGALLRAVRIHGTTDFRIPPGPDFFALSDRTRSEDLLRAAGFENPRVDFVPQVWRLTDLDDVFEAFRHATVRMRAVLQAQSADQLSRIRVALQDELSRYRGSDGFELPMPALLATGHKPIDG